MPGATDPEVWRAQAAAADAPAVARAFERFGSVECAGYSRFYEELSLRVAREPRLVALCVARLPGQPAPNLLFGAVRTLLAEGRGDPLAAHYRRAARDGPTAGGAEAWEPFLAFVLQHADDVRSIVASRRVQTNEPGRAAPLAYGLAAALAPFPGRPVALVEVGTSAGLLLALDRYAVAYRGSDGSVVRRGPASSPVEVTCELRAPAPHAWLEAAIPVASRTGIDLHPVDVRDPSALRWLLALVWPERPDREKRLVAAAGLLAGLDLRLHAGNAAALLPEVLDALPPTHVACVFHSSCWHQVADADRRRIDEALAAAARRRALVRVALESHDGVVNELRLGLAQERLLARAHPHGTWLEPVALAPSARS